MAIIARDLRQRDPHVEPRGRAHVRLEGGRGARHAHLHRADAPAGGDAARMRERAQARRDHLDRGDAAPAPRRPLVDVSMSDRADLRRRRPRDRHHGHDRRHHARASRPKRRCARARRSCASRWTPRRWACGTGKPTPTASAIRTALNELFGRPGESPHVDYRALQQRLHPEDREHLRRPPCATRSRSGERFPGRLPRRVARRLGALDRQPRAGASRRRTAARSA